MVFSNSVLPMNRIAADGFKLSLLLSAVSSDVANAGVEVQSISKGVTQFSMLLKNTSREIQSADSVHSQEAVETAQSIADEGTRAFDEINEMLDRVRSARQGEEATSPSIRQRFRQNFRKHRVVYLLAQLESLQLSLSVMLQVLQLGTLLASTNKHDRPEEVAIKMEAINQERAVAQNAVIVRYWQMSNMDVLFQASQEEEQDQRRASVSDTGMDDGHPPSSRTADQATSTALVRLPVFSLGQLDHDMHQIRDSPRDMVQISNQAIDPLLERWTVWREVRERRHNRNSGGRYAPSVDDMNEDEDQQVYAPEDGARGFYLEGTTQDWRKPNSAAARHEAHRRRKQYSGYQPSVSAASSDVDESPNGSISSKRRSARRHVIDSGSESSTSEPDQAQPKARRRRSSPTVDKKPPIPENSVPILQPTTSAPAQPPAWTTAQSGNASGRPPSTQPSVASGQSTASRLSSPAYHPPGHRPWATPDQNMAHHSVSSPTLQAPTFNISQPYGQPQIVGFPRQAGPLQVQSQQPAQLMPHQPTASQSRYVPQSRMSHPGPRPVSQDGKAPRSPSRLSQHSTISRSHDERRFNEYKKSSRQNFKESATKGLLGAGAIAGFLEALEGFSL